jgi:CIC family chloride channel protein
MMVFISVYLVKQFSPEAGGSGIHEIEGVVGNRRTMNGIRVIVVKFVGGLFSLGGGMAMGREGPSVQIGGALGQLISRSVKLPRDDINVLIAAGAGAGLAAAFNAPLAGLLFVFEEMRKEIPYSYIPVQSVIVSTVMSIITLRFMVGNNISIPIDSLVVPVVSELWIFAIFGLFFGLLGFIFNRYLVVFTTKISTLSTLKSNIATLLIGAFIGLLLYFYPDSVGEGYESITKALHENIGIQALLILFSVRFLTTLLSYGTGAPGGIFAPMLALGTLFGIAFGLAVDDVLPALELDPMVFAIVGMSALFSATVRAPITGIVLVAEMTSSFDLLMPLLITSLSAVIVANALGGRAIYTVLLENTLKIAKFGKK